jgi:hypothetical protein
MESFHRPTIEALGIEIGSDGYISDTQAMDAMAVLMRGPAWNADTLDAIAEVVQATNRNI